MKQLTDTIDLDQEVQAICQYIALKWTPIENAHAIFSEIRDEALHHARAWFNKYSVGEVAHKLHSARNEALQKSDLTQAAKLLACYYDSASGLLDDIWMKSAALRDAATSLDGSWDYSKTVSALSEKLLQKYPQLSSARPLGWATLAKGYCEFDGQDDYEPGPDEDLFEGTRAESMSSGHFVYRTALPYVLYDEKCRGLKAYKVLVGAVLAQFLCIQEHLNTVRMKRALEDWAKAQPEHLVFDALPAPDHPLLKALATQLKPPLGEQTFNEALKAQEEWAALPDEEKAARKKAYAKDISTMLDGLKTGDGAKAAKLEQEQEVERLRAALREELSA